MNSNNRIAATLIPRDIVCLRNISINTLHKGGGGDDDDDNDNELQMGCCLVALVIMHVHKYEIRI